MAPRSHDMGSRLFRHRQETGKEPGIIDQWRVADDRPVRERGHRRLQVEDLAQRARHGDHVGAERSEDVAQLT